MSQKPNDSGNNGAGADKSHGHPDHAETNNKRAEAKTSHEADLGMEKYSKSKSEEVALKRQMRKSGATGHGVPAADSLLPKDSKTLDNHIIAKNKASGTETNHTQHQIHAAEAITRPVPSQSHDENNIVAHSHRIMGAEKSNVPVTQSGADNRVELSNHKPVIKQLKQTEHSGLYCNQRV